jgi:hypothetical protein
MATKLTRQKYIPFGNTVNAASEICEFGTPATGSPVYTNVIATLQAGAAWLRGFAAETVANNRPFLEDFNCIEYVVGYMLGYIFQMGIPEYDAATTYFNYSICQYNGIIYQCINDGAGAGISGFIPTNTTYWIVAINPGVNFNLSGNQFGAWTIISTGTVYQASTDGEVHFWGISGGNGVQYASISTDSSSSPSSVKQHVGTADINYAGFVCSVKKGDYYIITSGFTTSNTAFWLPSGS